MHSTRSRAISPILALTLSFGCRDAATTLAPTLGSPSAAIWDATDPSGTPHFYFLPPLVGNPESTEAPDTSLAPFIVVEICEWLGSTCAATPLAQFTTATGPGSETLRIEDHHFAVNWHTDQFELATEKVYRIHVRVAGTELGHADVNVVASGKELKNVDSGEFIGLLDGRTLPIQFTIGRGAVHVVGPAGGTLRALGDSVRLDVPPNALVEPVGIVVLPSGEVPHDSGFVAGAAYELRPAALSLARPATLSLAYDPAGVPAGTEESALRLHRAFGGTWVEIFDSEVDPAQTRARGSVARLGVFGVLRGRSVAHLAVSPDFVQLAVGDTTRLAATPRDADGNPLRRPVAWATSDSLIARVDRDGHVRAGASGSVTITASAGGRTGAARVVVDQPGYPNEPEGFIPITERSFDAREEQSWRSQQTELLSIAQDPTAPRSPANVGQALFPTGFPGGESPVWSEVGDFSHLGYRKLYLSFWIKISENWQGHASFFNKIGFVWMHHDAVVFPTIKGVDAEPLKSRIALQAIPVVVARNLDPNVNQVEIVRGRWHRWEIVILPNEGDLANGAIHWWIDGIKVGEHTDVQLRDSTQSDVFQYVQWYPIWGGVNDVVEDTMYMWMDHFYVSGAP